ncbi:FAD-dependent oxidoreductase [Streptomyces sp. NRRL B-24720]|uniref:FAD-dependent oxidoreductase n=1 Tax=Streptomyces sp. NRRL B-24720 TaxID=1476876 RepID=UPI0004C89AD9|nr:FAD-dependent oxidoreductase [Streptomyces sp. NRRL B-24720]
MPHALTELKVRTVTKPAGTASHRLDTDVCVVGAGVSGISAAIESAQLGREVVLVDSLPVLGGQMVNSLIGLLDRWSFTIVVVVSGRAERDVAGAAG